MAHTSGPWKHVAKFQKHWVSRGKIQIADVFEDDSMNAITVNDNASLIAAAPELLVELEKLVDRINRDHNFDQRKDGLSSAREVIAKAKGGA